MRRSRRPAIALAGLIVIATTLAAPLSTAASATGTAPASVAGQDPAAQMEVVPEPFDPADFKGIGTDTVSLYQQSAAVAPRWLQRRHPALAADARESRTRTGTPSGAGEGSRAAARNFGTNNNSDFVPGTFGQHLPTFCGGDGVSGKRVQAMYVREAGSNDRYGAVKNILLEELRTISDAVYVSGVQTGGGRQVRWVTEGACQLSILNVTVPAGALDTWQAGINALDGMGYNKPDRKYLIFADESEQGIGCGLGTKYADTRPTGNLNDTQTGYARVDTLCWTRGENAPHSSALHELGHVLGAVMDESPNSTGGGHCTDENDVMCYADGGPKIPNTDDPMRYVCPSVLEDLFDCNGDDYFNVNPAPGSWLATHWNVANSGFLADDGVRPGAKVTMSSTGPAQPESGDQFTLTAEHSDTAGAIYRWTSNAPQCLTSGASSRTVTVQCTDYSGPLNVTVEVKKANGAIVLATRDIAVTRSQGATVEIEGPFDADENQTFTLNGNPTGGKQPFTFRWDAFDPRCTLVEGSRTNPQITLRCIHDTSRGEIIYFRLTITGADQQQGVATHGVYIRPGGTGGGGGGSDTPPVVTLTGPDSTQPLVPARVTATANQAITDWIAADDQTDCALNQFDFSVWDLVCAEQFTGPVTVLITATNSAGKSTMATKTITVTRNGGTGTDTVSIDGATEGTAGRPLSLSARATGSPVAQWRWSVSNPNCQHGRTDQPTVTVWCDAQSTGPLTVSLQGTTSSGQVLADSETVSMTAPSVNVTLTVPTEPVTAGSNQTIEVAVTENGTGAPLKARVSLERSLNDGATWAAVRPASIVGDGKITVTERIADDTLYRAVGAGSVITAPVVVNGTADIRDPVRLKLTSADKTRTGYKFAGSIASETSVGLTGMSIKVQHRPAGTRKWKVVAKTLSGSGGKIVAKSDRLGRGDVRLKSVATDRYLAGKSSRMRIGTTGNRATPSTETQAVRPNAIF